MRRAQLCFTRPASYIQGQSLLWIHLAGGGGASAAHQALSKEHEGGLGGTLSRALMCPVFQMCGPAERKEGGPQSLQPSQKGFSCRINMTG